jgi:hypothetical protein
MFNQRFLRHFVSEIASPEALPHGGNGYWWHNLHLPAAGEEGRAWDGGADQHGPARRGLERGEASTPSAGYFEQPMHE